MKLSTAIRKGCEQRPQAFDTFFEWEYGRCIGSCALGAAIEGLTGATKADWNDVDFPILDKIVADPIDGFNGEMIDIISGLNDIERWSREKIADWVETIEEQYDEAR